MLIKTVGVVDVFRGILKPVRNDIEIAFIYGSIASGKARAESDVDIMIVGDVGLETIARLFRDVETQLGRLVNPTVYSVEDFQRRLKQESHFLRTVLGSPVLLIEGTRSDLERLAEKPTRETASDESPRTARSAGRRGARPQRRKA